MINQFLIETDILVDHLTYKDEGRSYLESLMIKGSCFTTVLNVSEVYFAAGKNEDTEPVDSLFKALKVLGISARYGLLVADFANEVNSFRDALFCAVAKSNKMQIVSLNKAKYIRAGLKVYHPKDL